MFAPALNPGTLMSSPDETAPLPDPLPAHLKALLELNRQAEISSWSHDWHLYMAFGIVIGFCLFGEWHPHNANSFWADEGPFLVICGLSLVVALHRAAEHRAQRRLQLLLSVIRGLERREDAMARR